MSKVNFIDADTNYIFGKNLIKISFCGNKDIDYDVGKYMINGFDKSEDVSSYITSKSFSLLFEDGSGCTISLDPHWNFEDVYYNLGSEKSIINNKSLLNIRVNMGSIMTLELSDESTVVIKPNNDAFNIIIREKTSSSELV